MCISFHQILFPIARKSVAKVILLIDETMRALLDRFSLFKGEEHGRSGLM
jgi:hypothetical protein